MAIMRTFAFWSVLCTWLFLLGCVPGVQSVQVQHTQVHGIEPRAGTFIHRSLSPLYPTILTKENSRCNNRRRSNRCRNGRSDRYSSRHDRHGPDRLQHGQSNSQLVNVHRSTHGRRGRVDAHAHPGRNVLLQDRRECDVWMEVYVAGRDPVGD